jgi:multidrug efflux pump subunit AcrA (membrane-fusion protein)
MYADVTLTTERHDGVIVVPKFALVREEEQNFVFVVEADVAQRRMIRVGISDADMVEVLDGVAEHELIVVSGHAGLRDGATITRVDASGRAADEP